MNFSPELPSRGRPRASSRAVLEEAAYELFLEQGYDGTTVAEIARRAGVSRGTFFNYFPTKADVFWGDIDDALERLPNALRDAVDQSPNGGAASSVTTALKSLAADFGPKRVPWILTQYETIGRPSEVGISVLQRVTRAAEMLTAFIAEEERVSVRSLGPRCHAYVTIARVFAAAQDWAEAGSARGTLAEHLSFALHPIPLHTESA